MEQEGRAYRISAKRWNGISKALKTFTYNAGGEKLRTDYYINPLPNMVPQVNGGGLQNKWKQTPEQIESIRKNIQIIK